MCCRALKYPNYITTSHLWEHQALIKNKRKQKHLKGQRRIRKVMGSSQAAPHSSHLRQLLLSEGKWSGRCHDHQKQLSPISHILGPALAVAANLISSGAGRGRASNENLAILLCPWQAAAAQGNNLHHLCSPAGPVL